MPYVAKRNNEPHTKQVSTVSKMYRKRERYGKRVAQAGKKENIDVSG